MIKGFFTLLLIPALLVILPSIVLAESSATDNYVLSVTDEGIYPKNISFPKEDSILLILNKTRESLISLEVDFGSNEIHCSSGNLKRGGEGKLRSARPVAPKDFASTCFHAASNYPVTIYGLAKYPNGLKTSINVY